MPQGSSQSNHPHRYLSSPRYYHTENTMTRVVVTPRQYSSEAQAITTLEQELRLQAQEGEPVIHVGMPCPPTLAMGHPYPSAPPMYSYGGDTESSHQHPRHDRDYEGDSGGGRGNYYVTGFPVGVAYPPGMISGESSRGGPTSQSDYYVTEEIPSHVMTIVHPEPTAGTSAADGDLTAALVIRHWLTSIFISELIMLILHVLILDYFAVAGSVSAMTAICFLTCRCLSPLRYPLKMYTTALTLWSLSEVAEVVGLIFLILGLVDISLAVRGKLFGGVIIISVWIALYIVLIFLRLCMIGLCQRARAEIKHVASGGDPEPVTIIRTEHQQPTVLGPPVSNV